MNHTESTHKTQAGVVIIGGGHAGATAAACLRQFGYENSITLVCAENTLPYQRPPLSKAWLMGGISAKSLELRSSDFYDEHRITLNLNTRATSVDLLRRNVALSDGSVIDYGHLVLATGSSARALSVPGCQLHGVLSLRDMNDACKLRSALRPGQRLVIVGAGFVGLETAATARKLGVEVIVIERESRVLARVSSPAVSAFFEARHRRAGVDFIFDAPAIGYLEGCNGCVSGVVFNTGQRLACDVVLVGVGAEPNDGMARDAGLVCNQGIVVNAHACTSDSRIYAIGDVSHRPMPHSQRTGRLESVANALEQARQAASAICKRSVPLAEVPWFWSDQYECKLQIAGLSFDADRTVQRLSSSKDGLAIFHLQQERLVAVEAVNSGAEFLAGKKLIASGCSVDAQRLADPAVAMKDMTSITSQKAYP